jgi:hypothetical protein
MAVTLEQILTLAGRLDDSREFDGARQRFRRFLRDYATDVGTARLLINQCRYVPGDQHRRALEDLVLFLGRFMGFDVEFGFPLDATLHGGGCGAWRAPGRLRVVVVLGGQPTASASADASAGESPAETGVPVVRLLIPSPFSGPRPATPPVPFASERTTRTLPLAQLVELAEMTAAGRLAHGDVVRMLESGIPVDFVVGLLERPQPAPAEPAQPAPVDRPEAAAEGAPDRRLGSGCWLASVPADHATTPEEFLELVVARRHVFGVTDRGTVVGTVRDGDGICFLLPGKGVVGHARVSAINDGAADLRDARRYRQVLRLEHLVLHVSRPAPLDPETELRLRAAPAPANRQAQTLIEISEASYRALDAFGSRVREVGRHGPPEAGDARPAGQDPGPPLHRDRLSG